jgi:hypothetical protein
MNGKDRLEGRAERLNRLTYMVELYGIDSLAAAAMRRECRSTPNAADVGEALGLLIHQQPIHEQEMVGNLD